MSKRDRARKRKEKRAQEQAKQQQRMMAVGAVIAVIVIAIGYFGFFARSDSNFEPTERMLLDPILGNPDAPVLIEEWGAYGCHACKSVHEGGLLDELLRRYPGQVKIVFRDLPIISPSYDQNSAEVAQCALDQGNEQFWLVHDWLYTEAIQSRTNQNQIIDAAGDLGLDMEALRTCVNDDTHHETVQFDLQRGLEMGLNSTPTFIVNGQRIFNGQQLFSTIESEIARLGG